MKGAAGGADIEFGLAHYSVSGQFPRFNPNNDSTGVSVDGGWYRVNPRAMRR
jgi:hypothetical protein